MYNLVEEYFLLALPGKNHLWEWSKISPLGMAIAAMYELVLSGHMEVTASHYHLLPGRIPPYHPALAVIWHLLNQSETGQTLPKWIDALLANRVPIDQLVAKCLLDRGVIEEQAGWFTRLGQKPRYQAKDPMTAEWIKHRLRAAALFCDPPAARSLALLDLLQQTGQLNLIFDHYEQSIALPMINRNRNQSVLEYLN